MTSTAARIGVTGLVLGAALTGAASPAQAAVRDGRCDPGELCLYFNSGQRGAVSDFRESVSNYGTAQPSCYDFRGVGDGTGVCIKNAAASVWNRSGVSVRIHYGSDFGGASQTIARDAKADLNATLKNQNASHLLLTTGGDRTSYRSGDDYPYRGQTRGTDEWQFFKGQCTSFAAHALNTRVGVRFSNYYKGPRWSDAKHWDDVARRVGIPVSRTPRAGSIAVRNSGTYGHVAFVTKVHSNGSFEVDEYNLGGTSRYSHRTTRVGTGSAHFDAFIHFT